MLVFTSAASGVVNPMAQDNAWELLPVSKASFGELRAANAEMRASNADLEESNAKETAILEAVEAKLLEISHVRSHMCFSVLGQ